ncbi:MAG: hypothetical protein KC912_17695 [Proteobacteria bacterium]|nr:hypothetical protein [Pseudomonadota bacterium]
MLFSHRDDPNRTASIDPKQGVADAFVALHTDAAGKSRKKTFKNGYHAALRFLLNKEGYIVRGPQDGRIRWMTRLMMNYYGEIGHGVDRRMGRVWVADPEDAVHCIEADSCVTRTARVGSGNQSPGCQVVCDETGTAWVKSHAWSRVEGGLHRLFTLTRVHAEEGLRVERVVQFQGPEVLDALSATDSGLILGPDADGAALYSSDGSVVQRWTCQALIEPTGSAAPSPVGAISRSGEWVALSMLGVVRRIHVSSGAEEVLPADFKTVNGVQIANDGTVFVSGFCYPSHGLYVLRDGQHRVSDDIRATISADGSRFVEASGGWVSVYDSYRESEDPMRLRHAHWRQHLMPLGMAKYGRAEFLDAQTLAVLTDAYTVSVVRISE